MYGNKIKYLQFKEKKNKLINHIHKARMFKAESFSSC